MRPARAREARCCTTRPRAYRSHTKTKRAEQRSALPVRRNRAAHDLKGGQPRECIRTEQGSVLQCRAEAVRLNRPGRYSNSNVPTRNNRQERCRQPQKARSNMNRPERALASRKKREKQPIVSRKISSGMHIIRYFSRVRQAAAKYSAKICMPSGSRPENWASKCFQAGNAVSGAVSAIHCAAQASSSAGTAV